MPKAPAKPVLAGEIVASTEEELKTIVFQGRRISVKQPAPDQLVAIKTVGKQFEAHQKTSTVDTDRVVRLWQRGQMLIATVIADPTDKEWLEDGYLDGSIQLADAWDIVLDAVEAWGGETKQVRKQVKARRG